MKLFGPTAKSVAKKFYAEVPSLASSIAASMPKAYTSLQGQLCDNRVFALISMNITAAALLQGVAKTRGSHFARAVSESYAALDPSLNLFITTLEHALNIGTPLNKAVAETVCDNSAPDLKIQVEKLTDYFGTFLELSQSIVTNSF